MSTSLPEQETGVFISVSRTVTKRFPCIAVLNPRKSSSYLHVTDEQMETQKGEMNAQGQGQDTPYICLVPHHCPVTLPLITPTWLLAVPC